MSTVSLTEAGLTRLSATISDERPSVRSKFIFAGSEKFFIKGVTYGAFRPNAAGLEFHDLAKIRRDFEMMRRNGINTVRIQHTVPPIYLLDIAAECGLKVMVGLSAEQYVGYMLDGGKPRQAFVDIQIKVGSVREHPALLCYSLGNEIPAALARWLGRERIEQYLQTVYDLVKQEDPGSLVTYVNYPSTEYLQLPFLDFCSFNVYLEKREEFQAYLARLQNIAVDRPLVITEFGLDSLRNGPAAQAELLDWQIRSIFHSGCAGAVVFSWTDEWYRGGDVDGWEFGLTDRQRRPRASLYAVRKAFAETPFPPRPVEPQPFMSVVVCTYNGSRTLNECLEHATRLNYPNYEVVVVDDGSTDNSHEIAERYDVKLIRTENRGLSAARNTGREQSRGEIVVYLDDDAYPDEDWLNYYARAFQNSSHALIGGPNLVPLDDPAVAQCVARAPGGPTHVLLTDTLAEHVPGCNMAFRKSALEQIGGFDPVFRTAGDDVDVCWRIQEQGWTIGFAPSAVVWHHRRPSIRRFWAQQRGYGKAEALLHEKWPERFNASNHLPWAGRIYLAGVHSLMGSRSVIYHGVWGEAPFQGLHSGFTIWDHLLEVPELYLLNAVLVLLSALGILWTPMLAFLPLLLVSTGIPLVRAALKARRAQFPGATGWGLFKLRALTAGLHVMQPLARLWGRFQHGLTPWKRRGEVSAVLPYTRKWAEWTETYVEPLERLRRLEQRVVSNGVTVHRGNAYEPWDLHVTGGLLGSTRVLMAVEDHGAGCQYVRVAAWPRYSKVGAAFTALGFLAAIVAAAAGQYVVGAVLALIAAGLLSESLLEAGRSLSAVLRAADRADGEEPAKDFAEERVAKVTEERLLVRDRFPVRPTVSALQAAAVRRSASEG